MIKYILSLLLFISINCFGLTITVPNNFMSNSRSEWSYIADQILYSNDNYILLYVDGTGGYDDIANKFIDKLEQAKKQGKYIEMVVNHYAFSNHARLVCVADKVTVANNAFLLFHDDFIYGIHPKIYTGTSFMFDTCVSKGILTDGDVGRIIVDHKAIVIYGDGKKYVVEDQK